MKSDKFTLIPGSGIDLDYFRPSKISNSKKIVVLFASRLLKSKGIFEFVKAAKEIRKVIKKPKQISKYLDDGGGTYSPINSSTVANGILSSVGGLSLGREKSQEFAIILTKAYQDLESDFDINFNWYWLSLSLSIIYFNLITNHWIHIMLFLTNI